MKNTFQTIIFILSAYAPFAFAVPDTSVKKCPKEILNSTSSSTVRLTVKYPHFKVISNSPDPDDNIYAVCRDRNLTDCKPTGLTSANSQGLIIIGNYKRNFIRATAFNDTICGMGGDDLIRSGDGNDVVYGNGGKDTLVGGNGMDTLYGGNGADHLYGLDEDHENFLDDDPFYNFLPYERDVLYGGRGKDYLAGGPGADILKGENGKDYLNGGEGLDEIDGGRGNDNCIDVDHQSGQYDDGADVDECAASESVDPL